jgi:hypothetical protein
VYRTDKSASADALTKALKATRIGQGNLPEFEKGDVVVCWGARIGKVPKGVRVLNNAPLLDKLEQIDILTAAAVPTVTVRRNLDDGWIHRNVEHYDGSDLANAPKLDVIGFWVKRENIEEEYRVHSFNGVSIRAGVRVPADENAHPWIRTYRHGWRISCDGFRSTPRMRDISHLAVKALGLEFGAVDVGKKIDGSYIVLEVNRAAGIENENTMVAYAGAIKEWANEAK